MYAPTANGDAAPVRQITNPVVSQGEFESLAADQSDTVYELLNNYVQPTIAAFGPAAIGNMPPTRAISGSDTGLLQHLGAIALSPSGRIAVYSTGKAGPGTITEYDSSANGNAPPINTITSAWSYGATRAIAFDAFGNLYVSTMDAPGAYMVVYDPSATGNATPLTTFIPDLGCCEPRGYYAAFTVAR